MTAHTKKILFTSHTANFSKFNRPFMRYMKAQGYEVHYASAGEEPVEDCDKHFTVSFERSPLSLNNVRAVKQLKKIIDAEKYDIIHTHTPMGSVVTRLAAKATRKTNGTRVIYTAHGFHFFKGAPLLNWLTYYPIEKLMAKYTDTLVTINKEDFARAKKHLKAKEVFKIDGVGVGLDKFKPLTTAQKHALRKKYEYKNDDFILLCVAEFTKNKNHLFLIDAFATLVKDHPHMKLIFVGKGDEMETCKVAYTNLNLPEDSISFLGYRNDVDKLCLISDTLVSASYREGLPVNIIEGMASSLPIVCTDIRGCNDLVTNKMNGYLYAVNDNHSFVNLISKLYTDRKNYHRIALYNVRDAEQYSVENAIKAMERIYG